MNRISVCALCGVLALVLPARGDDSPKAPKSAAEIMAAHDRALIRDLNAYIAANPKAEDIEQAYMTIFQKVIDHDWFTDHEATAKTYLTRYADGGVRPLAQIVTTMARAQADEFPAALASFRALLNGLGQEDQQEFAENFADTLALAATAEGQHDVAREVYRALSKRFGEDPRLAEKIKAELGKLDLVGQPAPALVMQETNGKTLRLAELKGKYVLIDFWATWCAPCVAELPNVLDAYAKYHNKGFEVIAVSMDDSKDAVADFVKARKVPWRQVHNATAGNDVVEAFKVTSIPATFLVGPDGRILRLELRGKALAKALDQLLK